MADFNSEIELANKLFAEASPSWAKDGSAERPAGPPQLPFPLQRPARMRIETPEMLAGGSGGGGDSEFSTRQFIADSNGVFVYAEVCITGVIQIAP